MSLLSYMRTQEAKHLWALRWVITGQFCVAGFLLCMALATTGLTMPAWLLWFFAGGMLAVALLASIAKAVNPPGGHLQLPLGDAVLPAMPTIGPRSPVPPGAATRAPEDAPPPPRETRP